MTHTGFVLVYALVLLGLLFYALHSTGLLYR
jgi:hypothetical protein